MPRAVLVLAVHSWNIGEAKAGSLKDLGAGEWQKYVCLEAGLIGKPLSLAPKCSWTGGQTFTAIAQADLDQAKAKNKGKAA